MKKCAKCDSDYDDAYDACPRCGSRRPARITVIVLMVLSVVFLPWAWPLSIVTFLLAILILVVSGLGGFIDGIRDGMR